MSQLLIAPNSGDPTTFGTLLRKSALTLENPSSIRELVVLLNQGETVYALLSPEIVLVLSRYPTQILLDLPHVVMGVPGLIYTGEWGAMASAFPMIDFSELESKLRKTGHTAHSLEDVSTRSGQEHHSTQRNLTPKGEDAELEAVSGEVDL